MKVDFSFLSIRKQVPVIRQAEAAECGLACMAMISNYHGAEYSLSELRKRHSVSLKGTTLQQLSGIANDLNFGARALKCSLEQLNRIRLPAVLHWDLNHFVVLESMNANGATILDPSIGRTALNWREVSDKYTGVALELTPEKELKARKVEDKLQLRQLVPFSNAFRTSLFQAILLSICLQVFVLVSPLFMQFVVDEAITNADQYLLTVIALGFGAVILFDTVARIIRNLTLQYLTVVTAYDMEGGVMRHLLRLPVGFFQTRFIGDIQQRFSALGAVQQLITTAAVSVIIDGVFAITLGVALLVYDPILALLSFVTMGLYFGIRLAFMRLSKRLTMDTMVTDANKQSHFLESLRAIEVIKVSGIEPQREAKWRNLFVESLNARVKLGNTNIIFDALEYLLLAVSNILIVYLAATSAIDGDLTVGMIIAFLAYKAQFEGRLAALVETWINFLLLDVNLERVADITSTSPEAVDSGPDLPPLAGKIELSKLGFAYADGEPPVFLDVDLVIEPGEFIVFIGKSGAGKTTLLKLIAGALVPKMGEIHIDGVKMSPSNKKRFQKQMGVMMQQDALLSGTIEQNIALFGDSIDRERLQRASSDAELHRDIQEMPMGYGTLVGDMGTSLSGGQQQRLYLARALYRTPQILIMDEGTSNLDIETEQKISATLRSLGITRVMAAHRPETIRSADRVYLISQRSVTEVTREWTPSK